MKKGKIISISVNPDMLFEGAQVMYFHQLLGLRVGKVKSIHKELQKVVFQEGFTNPFGEAQSGVLISELKIIAIEHEADNIKFQTPLEYSHWKNVIENKLLDTDKTVYFNFEIIYPEWNNYNAIDLAHIINEKDDDVYIGRLGYAIDFIQEHPEAIYDLIKASGKKFTES